MEAHGTLTLATSRAAGKVSIRVSDTGTGMEDQVRERVFEPFFTTKPLGKGTGMGLSMVYGTVQAMHGHITLATKLGTGTTITLTFPEASATAPKACESPANTAPLRLLDGLTILLIDDEPLVLRAGTRMLRAMGCSVLFAKDGREGIDLFQAHRENVALTIIDLIMPQLDGLATMLEILALAPQTPILLASGYAADAVRIESLLDGRPNVAFLAKPYDPKTLSTIAETVLPARDTLAPSSGRTGTE
jgi:two-component system, cell cycle sensor histidine kinase and response regulator CckA